VVGLDGQRYEYLLMTPTRLIATWGDMDAVWAKTMLSKKQRKLGRRYELIKTVMPWNWVDQKWVKEHDEWWPSRRSDKPKWRKLVWWWRIVGELRHGRRYGRGEYIPDPEPKPRRRPRRWFRRPTAQEMEENVTQRQDIGEKDMEAIKYVYGRIWPTRGRSR
jgi:hypothetical protein